VRALAIAALCATTACGAKTELVVRHFDARVPEMVDGGRDAGVDSGVDGGGCVGPDCNCLVGGDFAWNDVDYCLTRGLGVQACGGAPGDTWGDLIFLRGSCVGTYTIEARVVTRGGSGCQLALSTGAGYLYRIGNRARIRMSQFNVQNTCSAEALTQTGGHTCVRVSWQTEAGGTGGRELGCFAPFGPYYWHHVNGDAGVREDPGLPVPDPDGSDGEWEF
jgi:hypothetical protein